MVWSHKAAGKGCIHTENSQIVSIGAISTSTYQLDAYPSSSASLFVNYSWLSACPRKIKLVQDHPNTHWCLTSLRNKPQKYHLEQFLAPLSIYLNCLLKCAAVMWWWKVCLAVVCMKGGCFQIYSQIPDYFCYLEPWRLYNVLYFYLMILGKVIHPI